MKDDNETTKWRAAMSDPITAEEIRTALEDTTPGPWKWAEDGESMWLEGFDDADVLHGDEDRWVHMTQADGELVAAAPDLLARAADRIEQLEARLAGVLVQAEAARGAKTPEAFAAAVRSAINIAKEGA